MNSKTKWMGATAIGLILLILFVAGNWENIQGRPNVLVQGLSPNCGLAVPTFGTVSCEEKGTKTPAPTIQGSYSTNTNKISYQYVCEADCLVQNSDWDIQCIGWACGLGEVKVWINGVPKYTTTNSRLSEPYNRYPQNDIRFGQDAVLKVETSCGGLACRGTKAPDSAHNSVTVHDKERLLYYSVRDISGTGIKIKDSNYCRVQKFTDRLQEIGQDEEEPANKRLIPNIVDTWLKREDVEVTTLRDLEKTPNMKIGDTYAFFYDWRSSISLNAVYNEQGSLVYCNPVNNELFEVQKVTLDSGDCWSVPYDSLGEVECCNDGDCLFAGQDKEFCGPGFTCSKTKYCTSSTECLIALGQGDRCVNSVKYTYSCADQGKYQTPAGKKGRCEEKVERVGCCPDECLHDYHCKDYKECVPDVNLFQCPAGKCCREGGSYIPKQCSSGLLCCPLTSTVGTCKTSCADEVCDGDGKCEPNRGENKQNCADCLCNNNGVCEAGETADNCPNDCGVPLTCDEECDKIPTGVFHPMGGTYKQLCKMKCGLLRNMFWIFLMLIIVAVGGFAYAIMKKKGMI